VKRAMGLVVAVALLSTGCAHQTRVESRPSGAIVVENGEIIGTTPMMLDETTGPATFRTLEVQKDGRAQRFALAKEGWAAEPILGGVLTGVGLFVGGLGLMGGGAALYVVSLANGVGGGDPAVSIAGVLGGFTVITLGSLAMSFAPSAPLLGAAWFGRQSPEVVRIDLERGKIGTSPSEMAEPLIGRTDLSGSTPPATSPATP
jgi:hypothetical protein